VAASPLLTSESQLYCLKPQISDSRAGTQDSFMSMPLTDSNPLYHSQYLLGPIETIVCSRRALVSGHLSLHDIAEAYRVLSMRIRDSSKHLSVVADPFPALESLRDKGADVAAALRRDISRDQCVSAWRASDDSFPPAFETVGWEVTTYNTNRATDFSNLCHYALRLLSEIFRLPALSSVFTCTSCIHHLSGNCPYVASSARPWPSPRRCYFYRSLFASSILQCIKDHSALILGSSDAKAPERSSATPDGRRYLIP
jgi:hypothetical protein